MNITKPLLLLCMVGALAGCKLEIVAVQGGDVGWSGGSCSEGNNCVVQITDPNFSDSFTVTPNPGYEFVKWQKGSGFLCGDSTNLTCTLTMPADAGVAAAIIGVFATGYVMPVYKDVGFDTDGDGIFDRQDTDDDNDGILDDDDDCPLAGPNQDGFGCPGRPITETVNANGKVWAQTHLFKNVSWNEISTVCPAGVCNNSAMLNGFNLDGWIWADIDVAVELFNSYGISPPLTAFETRVETSSSWAPAFFADQWNPTEIYYYYPQYIYVDVLLYDSVGAGSAQVARLYHSAVTGDVAKTSKAVDRGTRTRTISALFYLP
jgi:hypothetical protein